MHTSIYHAKKISCLIGLAIGIIACSAHRARCQQHELVDRDGNRYPVKTLPDSNLWTISNLNLDIPGSYCYDNLQQHCEQYGRLYTWEAARKVCTLLGDGWRLPAVAEWQQLSRVYSPYPEDSNLTRKAAFKTLLSTGVSGFNAVLGGGRAPDSQYARMDAHGFYWTATQSDSNAAWFANFARGSQALYLQKDGEKPRAFSVRCLKKNSAAETSVRQ